MVEDKAVTKPNDLTGRRFGRLVVLTRGTNTPAGKAVWCCQCDCGKLTTAVAGALMSGNTASCGCARREEEDPEARFWRHVDEQPGATACWLWTGATRNGGYGEFNAGKGGSPVGASRFSWEIHNGLIPPGMFVLHNCPGGDNPTCVRPSHLWLGTAKDNAMDMAKKGRQWKQRAKRQRLVSNG